MENDREVLAQKIQEASERIRAGESELEEIPLPNESTLRIRRDPNASGQVIVEADRDGVTLRSIPFPPMESRPPDYPQELPFLPETPGTLSHAGEKHARTMVWPTPADPEAGFESLRSQILESGWTEGGAREENTEEGEVRAVEFNREGAMRSLYLQRVAGQAQLLVVDYPPKEDTPGQ